MVVLYFIYQICLRFKQQCSQCIHLMHGFQVNNLHVLISGKEPPFVVVCIIQKVCVMIKISLKNLPKSFLSPNSNIFSVMRYFNDLFLISSQFSNPFGSLKSMSLATSPEATIPPCLSHLDPFPKSLLCHWLKYAMVLHTSGNTHTAVAIY